MSKGIKVKIEREFGDVIGDGMKIVFRNLPPIFQAILWYAFPFIAISMIVLVMSGAYKAVVMPDYSDVTDLFAFISSFSIVGVGLTLGFLMINIIIYSAIMDYDENDGIVTSQGIIHRIRLYWQNYFLSIIIEGLIMGSIVAVMIGTMVVSPVLFGIVYMAGLICLLWIYNIVQFLGLVRIEEDLTISEGLNRCFYLLKNNWWNTFGVILVASLVGSILMYAFILPISLIIGLLSALQMESGTGDQDIWITILSGAFVILYAIIAILSNMYLAGVRTLKYYDLIERKEAKNLVKEIEEIGARESSSHFENEGEF